MCTAPRPHAHHWHFNWLIDTSTDSLTLQLTHWHFNYGSHPYPTQRAGGRGHGFFKHQGFSLTLQLSHWHFNFLIDTSTFSLTLQLTHWHFNFLIDTSTTDWHFNYRLTLQLPKPFRLQKFLAKTFISILSVSPRRNLQNQANLVHGGRWCLHVHGWWLSLFGGSKKLRE